jgi:hypothetical protein
MAALRSPEPQSAGGGLHKTGTQTDDFADDDRDDMIDVLTEQYGFNRDDLQDVSDDLLRAILRSHNVGDGDDDDGEPIAGEDDLPEPDNEVEREAFAEAAKGWVRISRQYVEKYGEQFRPALRRSKRAVKKYCGGYSDDANSRGGGGGMLASGVEKSTLPLWDAARYRKAFSENERGLRAMGIDSPEKLKAHREGKRVITHCDRNPLPKQVEEGRGKKLLDRFSESTRSAAVTFAESRIRRGDGKFTGQSKNDYVQIFLSATPAQRAEFLSAT